VAEYISGKVTIAEPQEQVEEPIEMIEEDQTQPPIEIKDVPQPHMSIEPEVEETVSEENLSESL